MVLLAGVFGPVAVGLGLVETPADASVSLFLVVTEVLPDPAVLAVAVLAVLLVVSSADTLFNAIASIVTVDLPRVVDLSDDGLTAAARVVTVVVAAAATVVGARGYSVLTLFLLADLLAAATFVPLLYGLYSSRAWSGGVTAASASGLLVGLAFFPPARGILPLAALPAASYFVSFLGAAGVSTGLAVLTARLGDRRYDLDGLGRDVRRLDDADGDAVADGGEHS
jgi:Na+/proline symporter